MNTELNFSEWEFTPVIDKVIAFQLVDGDTELMQQYCPDLKVFKDKQGNVKIEINENIKKMSAKTTISIVMDVYGLLTIRYVSGAILIAKCRYSL